MNNQAAIGYMILAAKELTLHDKVIKAMEEMMCCEMDEHTEEEAEHAYKSF